MAMNGMDALLMVCFWTVWGKPSDRVWVHAPAVLAKSFPGLAWVCRDQAGGRWQWTRQLFSEKEGDAQREPVLIGSFWQSLVDSPTSR